MQRGILLVVIVGALWLCAGVGRLLLYWSVPPRTAPPVEACLEIPEGSSLKKIALLLAERSIIRDPSLFILLARFKKAEHRIQSGEYCLRLPLAPRDVLDKLIRGDVRTVRVTIPEGSTIFDIGRILEESGLARADAVVRTATDPAFVKAYGYDNESLEGFLFPDTYTFKRRTDPGVLLGRMAKRFSEVVERELRSGMDTHGMTLRDIVTLASLVEKETGQESEKPLIAGVFFNRLRRGMRLECDPTVLYGVRLDDPAFQGRLRKKHLLAPTRYNTYQIAGLPHGPICNPGRDAIRAVLQPAEVEYLFFVSRNDGTHQFSRTLDEHNAAVQKYQRGASQLPSAATSR